MSTAETARAIADPVNDLGGRFMLDGATYARGAELGFSGMDFYFRGRAGVLGEVDAATVTAELGFFEPATVAANWDPARGVMGAHDAAAAFMACGHGWGRAHLDEQLAASPLADLVQRIADGTAGDDTAIDDSAAGADMPALFAAWRDAPWPTDPPARAVHAIHLLRELRGGLHVRAVREAGIDPHAAVVVKAGTGTAEFFGWAAPHPDPEACRAAWQAAESTTNDLVARTLDVLDETEQATLVRLLTGAA
jgi:hypothetical protein